MGKANCKKMLHSRKDLETSLRFSCKTSGLDLFIYYFYIQFLYIIFNNNLPFSALQKSGKILP